MTRSLLLWLPFLAACSETDLGVPSCAAEDRDQDGYAGSWDTDAGDCDFPAPDCDDDDAEIHPGAEDLSCADIRSCSHPPDADGDGVCRIDDCDDLDPTMAPGLPEDCDGQDDDCNGVVDDGEDRDGDGFAACDCDDLDDARSPGSQEVCDGKDNDCDGIVPGDEVDLDADGSPACEDCDDLDPTRSPDLVELCNGLDDDCSGAPDPDELDADGDLWARCDDDCDDDDPTVHPEAIEVCDGLDQDCDGVPDEGLDGDGDGAAVCVDCDDADGSRFPGAAERCNQSDDDCDGEVPLDEYDPDGDGTAACAGDCAPLDPGVGPGASEVCDGLDQDCDGFPLADEVDADEDGGLECAECDDTDPALNVMDLDADGETSCAGDCDDLDPAMDAVDGDRDGVSLCAGDCDDRDPARAPGAAETCDGVDNDCDGTVDEGYPDLDSDGAPECVEVCDGLDDDADGAVDEGFDAGGRVAVWVDVTALPGGDGTAARPFRTIQRAVDARAPIDPCDIVVLPGTYFERVQVQGGRLVVEGRDGPAVTRVDAARLGPPFDIAATTAGSRIEGLTLTGGQVFADGGGIRIDGGHVDLIDNVIVGNRGGSGGGVYCSSCVGTFSGNLVEGNVAETPGFDFPFGGGIAVLNGGSSVELLDNIVRDNQVIAAYAFGGGIGLWAAGEVTVLGNILEGNRASATAGGLAVRDGSMALVYNNLVIGNAVDDPSGVAGVELAGDRGAVVVNNTLVANHEGLAQLGVRGSQEDPYLANNIVAFGASYGVLVEWMGSLPWLHSDVYGNTLGGFDGWPDPMGTNGNLATDPSFVAFVDDGDFSGDDFDLGPGSPCVDAGVPGPSFADRDGTTNDLGWKGGPYGR